MKEWETTSELRSRLKKQNKDTIKLLDEVRNDFMDAKNGGWQGKNDSTYIVLVNFTFP